MPIVKCPKCGEEYDSIYALHSCKKVDKLTVAKEENREK